MHYRLHLLLTHASLAAAINDESSPAIGNGPVSVGQLAGIERRTVPESWLMPDISLVQSIASAFGIVPGSPEADVFWTAYRRSCSQQEQARQGGKTWRASKLLDGRFISGGRESHLDSLQASIVRCAAGGFGVRMISAAPGTGKTTLLAAACQIVLEHDNDAAILWGNCQSANEVSNAPLRDICQQLIDPGARDGLPSPVRLLNRPRLATRTDGAFGALVEDGPELVDRWIPGRDVVHFASLSRLDDATRTTLNQLVAVPVPMRQGAHPPVEAFARVLQRWGDQRFTVLVLDDMHKADAETCLSVHHLLHRFHQAGITFLLLTAFRPEELANGEDGAPGPQAELLQEALRLDPDCLVDLGTAVGGAPGRQFVDHLLDRASAPASGAFREKLFQQTDGLPLYATGILRTLDWDGVLPEIADHQQSGQVYWPSEIAGLFEGWLARLEPNQLQALQLASVQGEIFNANVVNWLMRQTGRAPDDLVRDRLYERHHLVEPVGVTQFDGRVAHQYRFHHDLLQEHVYSTMPPGMQRDLHRQTALAMQSLYGDDHGPAARLIARHFDISGEPAKAARAYLAAAQYDLLSLDYPAAVEKFQRSRDHARTAGAVELEASALVGLANCARFDGTRQEARRHAEAALACIQGHRQQMVEAEILYVLGMLDYDSGLPELAATRLEQAARGLAAGGKRGESGRASTMLSHCRYQYGEIALALRAAREARRIAVTEQDDWDLVDALVAEANCHGETGNYREALELLAEAAGRCESIAHPRGHLLCLFNSGLYAGESGDLEAATHYLRQAFDMASTRQAVRSMGYTAQYMGYVEEARGNWAQARRQFERACAIRTTQEQPGLLLDSLGGMLRVALAEGNLAEIRSLLGRIQHLALAGDGAGSELHKIHGRLVTAEHPIRIYLAMLHAAARLGDHAAARQFLEEALLLLQDRARKLGDVAMRESYITAVPAHRELLSLAVEQNLPGLAI